MRKLSKLQVQKLLTMGKGLLLFIFLLALPKPIEAQTEREEDSLLLIIAKTENDSIKMENYNKLRRATYYTNAERSLKYTKKYLEFAQLNKYPDKEAIANFYMGNAHVTLTQYDKALNFYLKSAKYFEKEKDSSKLASVLNGIGAAYENNDQTDLSLKYFKKSQKISERMGDQRKSALALNNIANIYTNKRQVKKAVPLLEKAVSILDETNDSQYVTLLSVNLGNAYFEDGQNEKAEQLFNETLKKVTVQSDALSYLLANLGLGKIAITRDKYKKAVSYFEEAFQVATEQKFSQHRFAIMKDLSEAYSYIGEHEKSLNMYLEYEAMEDSIFSIEKDKNLNDALQKYEAAKKDEEIAQQQLEIEKQNRQKNRMIWGAIALSLFVLMIIIFFRKRLKYQRTISEQNKALQKQKISDLEQKNRLDSMSSMIYGQESERMRIAKDLHDSLGGLLSTVKAHFSSIKEVSPENEKSPLYAKTNSLIDEACVEVRRISHNMMPHALTLMGLKDALTDLGENLHQSGIETTIEIGEIPESLDDTQKVMIYRLVQELLSNIRKHAQAKHVLLQTFTHSDKMTLIIEDDGKGFKIDDIEDGLGVKSVKSRVDFLHGTTHYDSQPTKGTSVNIEIPVP